MSEQSEGTEQGVSTGDVEGDVNVEKGADPGEGAEKSDDSTTSEGGADQESSED